MNFGPNGIPTDNVENNYEPLPEGWYQAQITEESEKSTKTGGSQLVYTMNILGQYNGNQFTSAYANRKVFASFNMVCPGSPKAEEIARNEIAKLAKACGLTNIRESSELVLKCVDIRLGIRKDEGYDPKNEVKGFRSSSSAPAKTPSAGTVQTPAGPQAPAGSTPPWGNR